ncbi:MAG TPA: GxxExxY protein [Pyrinomonadaceae bacterium]|nr:GxxExxY protein [Pyrinomonadaceae bacterium]
MTDYELTQRVIGCAMKVHSALGPGLLESAYKECLCFELMRAGLFAEKEKPMPLVYSKVRLDCGYRVDIMVERRLILEIKAVEAINDVHLAQVLTYLKLADLRLGLIMNFHVLHLRNGYATLSISTTTLPPLRNPPRPLRLMSYPKNARHE